MYSRVTKIKLLVTTPVPFVDETEKLYLFLFLFNAVLCSPLHRFRRSSQSIKGRAPDEFELVLDGNCLIFSLLEPPL